MSTDRHVELVELQRLVSRSATSLYKHERLNSCITSEQLEEASSYEERAALRKVLRDVKKGVLKPQEALEVARHQRSDQTVEFLVLQSNVLGRRVAFSLGEV